MGSIIVDLFLFHFIYMQVFLPKIGFKPKYYVKRNITGQYAPAKDKKKNYGAGKIKIIYI